MALPSLAAKYGKPPAQVVPHWHIAHGFSAIPKIPQAAPHRKNSTSSTSHSMTTRSAIDALDTGVPGGPEPKQLSPET